ncbi:MAG: polysaccharide deacetylase family protein [Alphaproteobacteria bacterium]|nr:polysaccharide deacetylase family protein [Alphaproteobacteria bacterium]
MTDWGDLTGELSTWAAAGQVPDFWWRDDDAQEPSPELDRLLDIAGTNAVPLALAVIPAGAGEALAKRLDNTPWVSVLQHGYAHRNYAGADDKKCELGAARPAEHVIAEIAVGWQSLETLFGAQVLPVMVPPWNRIAPNLVPMLPEIGFAGLSRFGSRKRAQAVSGLAQTNTHVDIIDWRGSRGFVGEEAALRAIVEHLVARRGGKADAGEPTGILTHHRDHDGACWEFLGALLTRLAGYSVWRSAEALFKVRIDATADSSAK